MALIRTPAHKIDHPPEAVKFSLRVAARTGIMLIDFLDHRAKFATLFVWSGNQAPSEATFVSLARKRCEVMGG